ncbi:MAG: DNA N-6-adenine-methyltransferase [Candidatus Limnocylindrus sp.]
MTRRQSMVAAALTSGAAVDSDESAHWRTPPDLVAWCAERAGVPAWDLDAAALAGSAVAGEYLGPDHADPERRDALAAPWNARHVWLNPPYSRQMPKWAAKVASEIHRPGGPDVIGVLVFARTDTAWWSTLWDVAAEVYFLRGRVSFLHPATGQRVAPAPAPSAFVLVRRDYAGWDPSCTVVDQPSYTTDAGSQR